MQYRIRIFADYCDSSECKRAVEMNAIKSELDYGEDKSLFITDGEDYTHVIIWNTAMPKLRGDIPKENVIGFACEPLVYLGLTRQFIAYAQKYISKYYIGDIVNLPHPFIAGNCYLTYNNPMPVLPKINLISIMISQKMHQPGHKYRHELTNAIMKTDLPVDIYGRGCRYNIYNQTDSRLKGIFERYEPYDGYKFHICIENVQSDHYFSEKIMNTLLTGGTPVYLGCKNIDKYFPDNVVHLSGNVESDIELIANIVREPEKYRKQIDVNKINRKISLLHNIDVLFTPLSTQTL
jgi:hypothetical protein